MLLPFNITLYQAEIHHFLQCIMYALSLCLAQCHQFDPSLLDNINHYLASPIPIVTLSSQQEGHFSLVVMSS
jgi:hypothetical protein